MSPLILRSIASFALCFLAGLTLCAAQSYDDGFEPKPPVPFPSAYNEYQILPGSVSPSGQCATIYPRRSVLFSMSEEPRLLLVRLAPFRVLCELPIEGVLAAAGHGSYDVRWAKDGAAVLFVAGQKWGPGEVFLIAFRDGEPEPPVDLADKVRRLLEPEFKKSKAPPFNGYSDFVFDSSGVDDWAFDEAGHVLIDCSCTSQPKGCDPLGSRLRWAPTRTASLIT